LGVIINLYEAYLEYCKPFKGSSRYARWAWLSCLSATLERRVWIPHGGLNPIYPNQFIVLCGGPGLGKTENSRLATNILKEFNKTLTPGTGIKFGPDKMTPAALLKRMSESQKTVRSNTMPSYNQSAVFLHSTEFSTMIKDIGGGAMSDDLLKLYDCDDYFEKEIITNNTLIRIPNPCLNLLADTTPSFLSNFLPSEESGTGLTARIIFAVELGRVEMDDTVPEGDAALRAGIVDHLKLLYAMNGPVTLDSEALVLWKELFKKMRDDMFAMPDGSYLRNFYARKPTHIKKIALTLACAENLTIINARHLQKALEIIDEAEPFMDKVFGVKEMSKMADASKRILDTVPWNPLVIGAEDLMNAIFMSGMGGGQKEFDDRMQYLVTARLVKKLQTVDGKTTYTRI